ncbi:MAG: flagellar export chaperone FliS [Nitrosomonadales bacterium]|nr:flagellar export chaperone FliS [Nitrosomonadales bacterium]
MFGATSRGVGEYKRIHMETGVVDANPHRLIIMLYEGAIEACQIALMHMRDKNIEKKGESLSKAIMIIESGLRLSLDKNSSAEITGSLDALYGYMSNRLYLGHIQNQPAHVLEVVKLLNDLKSAWVAIADVQQNKVPVTA